MDNTNKTYTYSYDALNRITAGILSSSNSDHHSKHNLKLVEYDKNGNILKLRRNGYRNNGIFDKYLDHLTYYYSGNQLEGILEEGNHYEGFIDRTHTSTDDYTYDANGNMTKDENKEIEHIEYNHLNLPTRVTMAQGEIYYVYDASGVKLEKQVRDGENPTVLTKYAGNYIYENDELQFFNHAEGYIKPVFSGKIYPPMIIGFDYVYQYKDHLGNVRLSYADSDNDGVIKASSEIIEESNYYPFGLKHKGYNNVTSANGNSVAQKWKYNNKELEQELSIDWNDYGARNYQPDLGRWMNLDALAEKYTNLSPYSYVANNVINAIDPDGRLIIFVGGLRMPAGNWDQWFNRGFYKSHEKFKYWRNYEGTNAFGQVAKIDEMFMNMHARS